MGNHSSSSHSSQLKKKYFKVVEKVKREYNQRKFSFIVRSAHTDWRVSVYSDLEALESYMPDMRWPAELRRLLQNWDILRDQRWRSNTIWFDYLNTTSRGSAVTSPGPSNCQRERPVPSVPLCELECKTFLEFFSLHLDSPETHAVAAMIQVFHREFREAYVDKNCDTSEGLGFHISKAIRTETDVQRLLQEVHLIIELCVETFRTYYGGIDLEKLMSDHFKELQDLITEKVLTIEVHDILLQACARVDADREVLIMQQIARYSDITTVELGIESIFCIDTPRFEGQDEFGYGKAIRRLIELKTIANPMHKLMCILDTTQRICECIDDYWKFSDINRDKLIINADQILSIFIYVVMKAKITNMNSHVRLINEFVGPEVQRGNPGYYIATIEACLEHILLLDEVMLRKLRGLEKF